MSWDLSLNLSWTAIAVLALVSIAFIAAKASMKPLREALDRHWIVDGLYDGLTWIPIWFIGNEWMAGWLSAIVAVVLAAVVDRLLRHWIR